MTTLWNYTFDYKKIKKPIRLIELFAGIGAQAKALENLGVDFEHYRVCEFDECAINSYNAIHHTDFKTSDITKLKGEDLGIVDTNRYEYIMTYSFPCQSLSVAGKMAGMDKGSETRSSLLWEVERLLNETDLLPQVLVMENVTQVHNKQNNKAFEEWQTFLEDKGYTNYWEDLNAKDFGLPQNRARTFMVSILGDFKYDFPEPTTLDKCLLDYLEPTVDEKFYLSDKKIVAISKWNAYQKPLSRVLGKHSISPTLTARGAGEEHSGMVLLCENADDTINVQEMIEQHKNINDFKVRKLTPKECFRLMGFNDTDHDNAAQCNNNVQLYKQAGNSICVNVLMALFKEMI